jgi:2-keto-4-pentenoate hydratase/2-oxohepta-3-ene-1,7-dioic acid hydratase in catechol pathway
MKIGHYSDGVRAFWSVVTDDGSARELLMPFEMWAAALAPLPLPVPLGDRSSLALGPPLDRSILTPLAPLRAGARVFGVERANPGEDGHRTLLLGYVKPAAALIGAGATMRTPAHTKAMDCEPELVVVMGRRIASRRTAAASVLGLAIGADTSIRDVGRPTGAADLYTMKAQDHSSPVGPTIVTEPHVVDAFGSITVSIEVNGQPGRPTTGGAVGNLAEILLFVDERCRLRPGDLVFAGSTETEEPVAGRWLEEGDRVVLNAEQFDELEVAVGAREPAPAESSWAEPAGVRRG